jgi:PAS domain S-box-containing protein
VLHAVLAKDGQPFWGTDPFSDPTRQVAFVVARDRGDIGVTLSRPSNGSDNVGAVISVYAPVYAGMRMPTTIEDRRASLAGIVSGIFSILDLLNASLGAIRSPAGIIYVAERPFVGEAVTPLAVLTPDAGAFVPGKDLVLPSHLEGAVVERELRIGGQSWYVLFHFRPTELAAMQSNEAMLILMIGMVMTLALGGYVFAQRHRVERLVSGLGTKDRQLREASADLAHSNAWLLAAIDSSPTAMIGLDLDAHVMSWNAAAVAMFGYTAGEALGRFPVIVPSDRVEIARKMIARTLAGETIRGIAGVAYTKSGARLEVLTSTAPIRSANGKISGLIAIMVDMTEQRRVETRLRQVVKMEALGQLTGGMAHDFNNLLGIIVGNLDMLRDKLGDRTDLVRFVDPPLRAALKGSELNSALLAFSQRQDLEPRRLEIGAVVSEVAKMLSRTLGENIVLDVQAPKDLWQVIADPAQLSSAMLHLAVNARDAMPDGGRLTLTAANVWVDHSMRRVDPDLSKDRYVCLSVTDTGTGMSAEVISHAFEPFFTTKRDSKGAGLGLAQVLGFAKQSGGTARIYSEVGHGTSVHLYLPCAEVEDGPVAGISADGVIAPGQGESILVVEDNLPLRDVVVGQLETLGYRPRAVSDGPEALAALEDGTVDLLFTDIVMPGGMDGRQLVSKARAKRPDLKVLFTSGFAGAAGSDGSVLPGRLLRKPYRMQDLAIRVREALGA